MSAQDALNKQQFMSVKDVGELQSYNLPAHAVKGWANVYKDELPSYGQSHASRWGIKDEDDSLYADVGQHGIRTPLDISHGMLMEGHHRWAAANAAGLDKVPVRYGKEDAAYHDLYRTKHADDVAQWGP